MQLPPCSRQKLIAALIEKAAVNRRQIEMNEHTKIGVVDNVFFLFAAVQRLILNLVIGIVELYNTFFYTCHYLNRNSKM